MKRDKKFYDKKEHHPIQADTNVWCPLCDWHATDSMTTRRKLGLHIINCHPSEVLFSVHLPHPDYMGN